MSRATEGFSAKTAIVPDSDAVILLLSLSRYLIRKTGTRGGIPSPSPFESKVRNVLINCGRFARANKKSRTENTRFHLFFSLPAISRALRGYRSTGLSEAG